MLKMLSLCRLSTAVKAPQKQTTHKKEMIPPNIKKEERDLINVYPLFTFSCLPL